jgi:hypothetical protein
MPCPANVLGEISPFDLGVIFAGANQTEIIRGRTEQPRYGTDTGHGMPCPYGRNPFTHPQDAGAPKFGCSHNVEGRSL